MTQFREGDIVSVHGLEGTVEAVWVATARVRTSCTLASYLVDYLTLLRRPVRVGDVLTKPEGTIAFARLPGGQTVRAGIHDRTFIVQEEPRIVEGLWAVHGLWLSHLHHSDGTPIEPPKAEEKPASIALRAPLRAEDCLVTYEDAGDRYVIGVDPADRADAHALAHVITKTQPPTVEQLARALFETDDRVIAFVDRVSDWAPPGEGHMAMRCSDDPHWKRALQTAWDRNEGHWKNDALDRASQIRAVLLQREGNER